MPINDLDPEEAARIQAQRQKYAGMTQSEAMRAHINSVYSDPAEQQLAWNRWQNSLVAGRQPQGSRSAKQAEFMGRRGMGLAGGVINQSLYDQWAAKHPNQAKSYGGGAGLDQLFVRQHPYPELSWFQKHATHSTGFGNAMAALALGTIGVAAGPAVAASFGGGGGAAGAGAASGLGTAGGIPGVGAGVGGGLGGIGASGAANVTGLGALAGGGAGAAGGGSFLAKMFGGGKMGASDWLSALNMISGILGNKDKAGDAKRMQREFEKWRKEAKRRMSTGQIQKTGNTLFPGMFNGNFDSSTPGGAAMQQIMDLINGKVSTVGYERGQEQAEVTRRSMQDAATTGLTGMGINPASGMGQALNYGAIATGGLQRNEALRDLLDKSYSAKQQGIQDYGAMLQQILGLQGARAGVAQGGGPPPQFATPSTYDNTSQFLAMLTDYFSKQKHSDTKVA